MSRTRSRVMVGAIGGCAAVLAASAALGATGAFSAPGPAPTVVASHLDNPRGLDLQGNQLYVAAAGAGGKKCAKSKEFGTICVGATSKVFRVNVTTGKRKALATGLPSGAGKDGSQATGVDDVSVAGGGSLFGIETYGPKPVVKLLPKSARKFNGKLLSIAKGGATPVANIARFEIKHDPDKQGVDSDPYSVFAASKHTQYVADAAGNDVLKVHNGHVSLVTVLPNIGKNQAVPTSITRGPGGDLYVGELVGFEKPTVGASRIYKVTPSGNRSVYAKGLNRVVGVSFDNAGNLFATELTTKALNQNAHGAVIKIAPNGAKCTVAGSSSLAFPAGGVVTPDGSTLYVSNFSILPGSGNPGGQVVSLPASC